MPRRVYTYEDGLGWSGYNLVSSIGAIVLTAGLVLVFANLATSLFRGARVGPDPWCAPTLEWTTTSPPPPFNFPVIPTVTSAYPNWDRADREADARRLAEGVLVLEEGHETPATTVLDARLDDVLEMPPESPWPVVLTLCLVLLFVMLLTGHYALAGGFAALGLLTLAAWHAKEPGAA
jgi:hypothetical protein